MVRGMKRHIPREPPHHPIRQRGPRVDPHVRHQRTTGVLGEQEHAQKGLPE
jgi:hypothetical protein